MALKKDELANPDGCLNRAADDEPIFVLRANDELAASVVRIWAQHYRTRKEATNALKTLTERQESKYQEALKLAQQMDDWRRAQIQNAKVSLNEAYGRLLKVDE